MATNTTTSDSGCPKTIAIPVTVSPSTLSGYTRISEFTFTPYLTGDFATYYHKDISSVKVVWDFGDGYTLSAETPYEATHSYDYPGQYTASLFFYDSEGTALLNTLTETVSVRNYHTNTIQLTAEANKIRAGVLSQNNKLTARAEVSWQDYVSSGNTIYFAASGDGAADLYDETYKFSHLLPFRAFYNSNAERIRNLTINLTPKYYILDGTTPTLTTADASGAKLLGATGDGSFYYFDDNQGSRRIFAALDTSSHTLPDYFINQVETNLNLAGLNYQESNVAYTDIESISAKSSQLILTSTGSNKMTLPSNKRQGDKFQVFVAAGDSNNNIHKYYSNFFYSNSAYDASTVGAFKVTIDDGTSVSTSNLVSSVSSSKFPYNNSLSSSYLSSFFYFNYTPTTTGNFTINVEGFPAAGQAALSGSYTFTVYPSAGNYKYKVNEVEFDMSETLKSYRFQDFLNDYDQLFDGVIGTIVGVASSSPTTYGKTIYEKISNFVLNRSDVDTCNIDALQKFYEILNEEASFRVDTAPPELQRLIDLYSIRLKRLTGDNEKFGRSFETFFTSNSAYGKNVDFANEINVSTYTVSANTNFVAVQKFNNENILIQPQKIAGAHTYPTSGAAVSTYPLSAYNVNSNWGWPLDTSVTGTELTQLYNFYPYVDGFSNTKKNSVLDYTEATHNTITDNISAVSGNNIYVDINSKIREGLNI